MGAYIDLSGKMFGRLLVKNRAGTRGHEPIWECECSCGKIAYVGGQVLRSGKTQSCGCFMREKVAMTMTTHGGTSGGSPSPEYRAWLGIKYRCYNSKSISFKNYGEKGIDVCPRWKDSFQCFLEDMGNRPSGRHSIERIDSTKGYSPENCIWAPITVQNNNTSRNVVIEVKGERLTAAEWGRRVGVRGAIILQRIRRGWDPESAVYGTHG